jgi:cytochrome c553
MANACGSCHQALDVHPSIPAKAPPTAGDGIEGHMARHQWAADRMWVSLVLGSEQEWREALGVLDASPASEFGGRTLSLAAQAHATTVHDKARAALDDDNPDTRSDLYGQIVAACAGCHLEQGVPG